MSKASKDTALATPVLVLSLADTSRQMLIDNPPERLADIRSQSSRPKASVSEPFDSHFQSSQCRWMGAVHCIRSGHCTLSSRGAMTETELPIVGIFVARTYRIARSFF